MKLENTLKWLSGFALVAWAGASWACDCPPLSPQPLTGQTTLNAPFGASQNLTPAATADQTETSLAYYGTTSLVAAWIAYDASPNPPCTRLEYSTNGGVSWVYAGDFCSGTTGDWVGDPCIAQGYGTYYLASINYRTNGGTKGEPFVWVSTDFGAHWINGNWLNYQGFNYFQDKTWVWVPAPNTAIVAWTNSQAGQDNIWSARTTNGGTTWSAPVNITPGISSTVAYFNSTWWSNDGNIFMAVNDFTHGSYDLMKSTNFGATWSAPVPTFTLGSSCHDFNRPVIGAVITADKSTSGSQRIAVTYTGIAGDSCDMLMFYSTDGGTSWAHGWYVPAAGNQNNAYIDGDSNGEVWPYYLNETGAGTNVWNTFFWHTTDWGATFNANGRVSDHNFPLAWFPGDYNTLIGTYSYVANAIWGGDNTRGNGDAYYTHGSLVSGVAEQPGERSLNPGSLNLRVGPLHRGEVQLNVDIPPGTGRTTLSVYDLSGRLVETLYSGSLAPGTHRFEWNGDGHRSASGSYFARLVSGNKGLIARFLYLK